MVSKDKLNRLVDRGIISVQGGRPIIPAKSAAITGSALEGFSPVARHPWRYLPEIGAILFDFHHRLKSPGGLYHIIQRFRRQKLAANVSSPACASETGRACELARQFTGLRPGIPINTICLLDSLAMFEYLRRRNIWPTLVFGISQRPFSAHCWVQLDGTVLNDAVGYVRSRTTILTV
ncbi:lasso peptide biosynthesis B2 protein [Asticcacaulis sp. SL142]|uniref:lasso peptide biosynthesis B2 protein n=1 Tax=Asticcacaulis sp. SL142 TaxID=2995155 RepID=UPI00226CC58B|nr:lasso peptide biosynthesis B2 protein [Asticcacaulis sp. SL142]WAC49787.1 lasso peptide biosynthesis B2 protein [Asticcacaulis sp. SL142]